MADRRYYWFKLSEKFFESDGRDVLKHSVFGRAALFFYLKLILVTLRTDGLLGAWRFNELNERTLAGVTGLPYRMVKRAYARLSRMGLVRRFEDGSIMVEIPEDCIGSESHEALRKRKYRKGHCPNVSEQCPTDIDKETDIDKNTEPESDIKAL